MKRLWSLGLFLCLLGFPVTSFAEVVRVEPHIADFSSVVRNNYVLLDVPLVIPPFLYRPVQMPDAVSDSMMQEWGKLYNASLDGLYRRNMAHY